jgi:hypothetical protein
MKIGIQNRNDGLNYLKCSSGFEQLASQSRSRVEIDRAQWRHLLSRHRYQQSRRAM